MNKRPSKKQKDNLTSAVEQILQLKALQKSQDDQMAALKKVVDGIIQQYPTLLVDGECVIDGVGRIKQALNKPQLISIQTGKPITDIEAAGLLAAIGDKFAKVQVSVTSVRDAINANNKEVIKRLAKMEVEFVQETRLDVKPL